MGIEKSEDTHEPGADYLERLERIESLLTTIDGRQSEQIVSRRSWKLFWLLVILHCVVTLALLGLDLNASLIWGWLAGAMTTLGTWHGLSLRPIAERWLRSVLAMVCLLLAVQWLTEMDLEDLGEIIPTWIVLFGGATILGSRVLRIGFRCGIVAPDGDSIPTTGMTIGSLFGLAAISAVFLACCRLIAWVLNDSIGPEKELVFGSGLEVEDE